MRKLLMASVAVLGASLGIAQAAEVAVVNPSLPVGTPSASTPPGPALSGFGYKQTPLAGLAPGEIVVRMELQLNLYFASGWDQTSLGSVRGDKVQPYGILGYPRFYFGFDAEATNGLLYGTYFQIRDSNSSAAGSGTAGSAGASGATTQNTLFWRNEYGYIGTAQLGIVRIGASAGPMGALLTGTFDDIATGGWNGDINDWANGASYGLQGSAPNWPFYDIGNEYTTTKIVYISPKFFGMLDGGFSYEPSTGTPADTQNCNPATSTAGFINCNNQSTSTAANDLQRRRNTVEAGLRFGNVFNGVGVNASIAGMYGGHVLPAENNPGLGGATFTDIHGNTVVLKPTTSFENLGVGFGGATVTFAGFTVGGAVQGGQVNGQGAALNTGGHDSFVWTIGGEYNTGPLQVGASWYTWKYQGFWTLPGRQTDSGLLIGTSYNIAPGLNAYAEYLYGQRYKGGFDFSQGAPGANFNNTHVNIFGLGLGWRW